MINESRKKSKEKWNLILNSGNNLSKKDSEEMNNIVNIIRKEKGFRKGV